MGCPIRKSRDVMLVCSSPQLIAAYHVLHRLSNPRHSPCALNCFKKFEIVVMLPPLLIDLILLMRSLSQYVKELVQKTANCDASGFEPLNRLYGYILFF